MPPPLRPLMKQVLSKGGVCFKGILHLRATIWKRLPSQKGGEKTETKKATLDGSKFRVQIPREPIAQFSAPGAGRRSAEVLLQ